MKNLIFTSLFLLLALSAVHTQSTIRVNLATEFQTIDGFGGMNHPVWIADLNEDQREKAFGNDPGEIGLSILRMHLDPNPNNWEKELPTALHASEKDAIIFVTPWDAPPELLDPNVTTEDKILPSNYDAYVQHLNAFDSYMIDNGVELYAISVQNEPTLGNWTQWTIPEIFDFMKNYAHGINNRVITPESFNFNRAYYDPILNDSIASSNFEIVGGHIYGNGLADYPLAREKGKKIWMTEHYTNSDMNANLWPDALEVGSEINSCMEANWNAYIWWYIRRFYGFITDDGNISKRGYVMSHYSKFIRPGAVRVEVQSPNNLGVTAYKTDTSFVMVVVNNNPTTQQVEISLNETVASELTKYTTSESKSLLNEGNISLSANTFTVELEPYSISTFSTETSAAGDANNQTPMADAGGDIEIIDEENNGSEGVMLNGMASIDADGSIVNYSWAMNGQQISFSATEVVELPIGEHEVILTVTDDDGAIDKDTITVTVQLNNNVVQNHIWLELECGVIGSAFQLNNDVGASNGQYITATPGVQDLGEASTDVSHHAKLVFTIEEAGTYVLWGRVRAPSPDDDSFWIKMDDDAWFLWNSITGSAAWGWDDVHNSNAGGEATVFNLDTGEHTLTVNLREDGADLDKFYLNNVGAMPGGLGETASNCLVGTENISAQGLARIFPNPAQSELSIDATIAFNEIRLYNVNGQMVLQKQLDLETLNAKIDVKELNAGIYFIHLNGVDVNLVSKILITR